jgi:DMSO reductase anchor subunit
MDSLPFLAFKVARASAFFAVVPGLWMVWKGSQGRYRNVWSAFAIAASVLGLICMFAMFSNNGTQADGWDTLGTIYWSSIAIAVLFFCAILGVLIGKARSSAASKNSNE